MESFLLRAGSKHVFDDEIESRGEEIAKDEGW